MVIYKRISMTLACASLMLLNACSSHVGTTSSAEESGLTVSQLYHQSMDDTGASWTAPHYRAKPTDYEG